MLWSMLKADAKRHGRKVLVGRSAMGNDRKQGEHRFGGPWTEIKLDAISDYLGFYTQALKQKPKPETPFILWYVDAFAGSGERTAARETGGILENRPISLDAVQLDGSAKRALAIEPPFSKYVFIEQDARRAVQLGTLAGEGRSIKVLNGDANEVLQQFFDQPPWSRKGLNRAVVFLDPYDMAVRWATLAALAKTKAVDVWYLFPLNATVRQLAHDYAAVDDPKQASLDEIFGTRDWREDLYKEEVTPDLFTPVSRTRRSVTQAQIEAYVRKRLNSLFPYVSQPLPLLTPRGAQLFSLFCLSANDSPIAHSLIERGVRHVLKKYG